MQTNVSIERCANCGQFLMNDGDYIFGIYRVDTFEPSPYTNILGYCCSKCGYMEGV